MGKWRGEGRGVEVGVWGGGRRDRSGQVGNILRRFPFKNQGIGIGLRR